MTDQTIPAPATALPWQRNASHFYGPDPDRHLVGQFLSGDGRLLPDANYALRACNSFPALVAALQGLMDHCGHSMECGFYDPGEACDCGSDPAKAQARAALSLALGEQ